MRKEWSCLNGEWDFAFDFGESGIEKGFPCGFDTHQRIVVPFSPETSLSGIGCKDFMPCVWYQRDFELPQEWEGRRIFLRFQAVDYDCRAFVNGREMGRHQGAGSSFAFDITSAIRGSDNRLVVQATDHVRSGIQPLGKQSVSLHSKGCCYTRTTGIWQTVWLEAVPSIHLDRVTIVPDLDGECVWVIPVFSEYKSGLRFQARVMADGNAVGEGCGTVTSGIPIQVPLKEYRVWNPGDPFLYDMTLTILDGDHQVDRVESYFGLRKIHVQGHRFFLNDQPLFLRFVLDQGFFAEGGWTAPSDEALRGDIERGMLVGFNGARYHQKIVEERYHYWADRLGYLSWTEMGDWGVDFSRAEGRANLLREWLEVVDRDKNHPSIIGWTPFNETAHAGQNHPSEHREAVWNAYAQTQRIDPSRPINDSSGYIHVRTDIYTVHDYDQDPETFRKRYEKMAPNACQEDVHRNFPQRDCPYEGQPYVVDEYGGSWWSSEDIHGEKSWGYGQQPQDIEEVYARIAGLTSVLKDHPHIAGFCYTQLTDVEQEKNGIYTYDRCLKFDADRIRAIFQGPATIP